MRQHKFVTLFVVVSLAGAFALGASVRRSGSAAAAPVDACAAGMYPNDPGNPSQLKVACTFTTATVLAGNMLRIEDFSQAAWHSGAARLTHADGHVTSGSAVVTSATGKFTAADVDRGITGTGIAAGTFIKAVAGATSVTVSRVATASATTAVLTVNYSRSRR
ncbi:MAG: hypothetical protein QOG50_1973, partial [Actinomycetota bacterium]|nr:hypothetical protein [Actinomycetota bacterium]